MDMGELRIFVERLIETSKIRQYLPVNGQASALYFCVTDPLSSLNPVVWSDFYLFVNSSTEDTSWVFYSQTIRQFSL